MIDVQVTRKREGIEEPLFLRVFYLVVTLQQVTKYH